MVKHCGEHKLGKPMIIDQNTKSPDNKLERDRIILEQHKLLQKALSALTMGHTALVNKDEAVVRMALKMQKGVYTKILNFMNEVKIHENRDRCKVRF